MVRVTVEIAHDESRRGFETTTVAEGTGTTAYFAGENHPSAEC